MRALLQHLRQPSLMRRTSLALLASFVLVLLVLLVHDYLDTRQDYEQHLAIGIRARTLAPSLAPLTDLHEAALLVNSVADMHRRWRQDTGRPPEHVFYQLRNAQGQVLLASPGGQTQSFEASSERALQLQIGPQRYWVAQADAGPWRLVIAEVAESDVGLLWRLAEDILGKLLIALPLVALPLWLALRTGFRPLTRLTRTLKQRDPQDLAPLGVLPHHRELQPLAQAFERLLTQLRQKVERERRFVQEAAHELRTPLAAITAQAHVLAHTAAAGERRQAEARLTQMLQRVSHLTQQLLDLAVLDEAGRRPTQPVDLVLLLEQALALASDKAQTLGLELSLEAPESFPVVLDLAAFQSVLHNLLENALRYVPAGGQIEVRLEDLGSELRLSVADDGPGIHPVDRARAFERFWRGASHQVSGTGLGLAIVRQAARHLGGSVSIEDGLLGRGVSFVLCMPRQR